MKVSSHAARLGFALPLAAGMTFCLFVVMQLLVAEKGIIPLDERERFTIEVVEVEPPKPPERKTHERPDEVKAPERPDYKPTPISGDPGSTIVTDPPVIDLSPGPSTGLGDGTLVAVVQVLPPYPQRAQIDGVEGYVVLEFTVLANGTVTDVVVLEESPKGYGFARSAIGAAKKFRYNAPVVNGKKLDTPGVREKFNFELEDQT